MAVVAAFLYGATAYGNDARLDPTFGKDGKLVVSGFPQWGTDTVSLPDGRTLVVGGEQMLALLPSGEVDTSFGRGGVASLQLPPKGSARIGTVLVDQFGRLLVVTSCAIPNDSEQGRWPSEDQPYQVLIERFTASGRLDLSFGDGDGMILTDFGLPPAEPGLLPAVSARTAAIDERGRILVIGGRGAGFYHSKHGPRRDSEPYVARLNPSGEIDQTFAGGGVLPVAGLGGGDELFADAQGNAFAVFLDGPQVSLARFLAEGQLDPGFGENGFRRLAYWVGSRSGLPTPIGLDPAGRFLISGGVVGHWEDRVPNGVAVKRVNPDGSLDRSFGHNGLSILRFPRFHYSAEALDDRGRVLIGVTLRSRSRGHFWEARQIGLALARLRIDGSLDRSFGRRGVFKIPLRGKRGISLEGIVAVDGKALIRTHQNCASGDCGTTLIRVDLGS